MSRAKTQRPQRKPELSFRPKGEIFHRSLVLIRDAGPRPVTWRSWHLGASKSSKDSFSNLVSKKVFWPALCAMLLALSFPAEAQQPKKIAKIGYLFPGTPATTAHLIEAFRQGLRDVGCVEGKDFVLVVHFVEGWDV